MTVAVVILLAVATEWRLRSDFDTQSRRLIEEISIDLASIQRERGDAALIADVERRIDRDIQRLIGLAVFAADGTRLVGNIRDRPKIEGWTSVWLDARADSNREVSVLATSLDAGRLLLVVGQSGEIYNVVALSIRRSLLIIVMLAILIALLGGMVMAAWNESRITAIDESLARISSGAIETRLPVKADGDEIDHLCLAVNDALDRLAAAMRGMEQVSNDIAHDLRTPLTRLRQRLEASRSGSRTVEQLEQTIDVAIGELDQAHDLFTTMLRIAQIEAGARRSAFATVDLSRLFAEIVETFQVVAEADGRRIEAAIVPKISFVGDREMLTQMIVNIVENALRHTPTGTTVIIQLESASDCAKALIADNGPGIAESDRERVFRRFVRLEAARSTPGTGLGLALVSAIAEVHKINILLDNHHPGLEVHLTFPNRVVAA